MGGWSWIDGDGWKWVGGWVGGWAWVGGWVGGWTDGRTDGWIEVGLWVGGWMDMDGFILFACCGNGFILFACSMCIALTLLSHLHAGDGDELISTHIRNHNRPSICLICRKGRSLLWASDELISTHIRNRVSHFVFRVVCSVRSSVSSTSPIFRVGRVGLLWSRTTA